jgi:predicted GNAT family acetyltransferase
MSANAHLLDRPVWNALTTRQAHFAQGDERAVRFPSDIGVFAAAADPSPANLAALAELSGTGGSIAMQEAEGWPVPAGMAGEPRPVDQMVAEAPVIREPAFAYVRLTDVDAPEMLALATLTRPGPFFARTHCLGDFFGVRVDGRLVAMAGERMKVEGFTEVSGVCTHPDHRGKGYAAGLMQVVMAGVAARGETTFLHVLSANTGAIGLYQTLGFRFRRQLPLTLLTPIA